MKERRYLSWSAICLRFKEGANPTFSAFAFVSVRASRPPGPRLFPLDRFDFSFASSILFRAAISVVTFAFEGTCASDCRDFGRTVASFRISSILRLNAARALPPQLLHQCAIICNSKHEAIMNTTCASLAYKHGERSKSRATARPLLAGLNKPSTNQRHRFLQSKGLRHLDAKAIAPTIASAALCDCPKF